MIEHNTAGKDPLVETKPFTADEQSHATTTPGITLQESETPVVPVTESSQVETETLVPQADQASCPTCGSPEQMISNGMPPSFVYALGRVTTRFPNMAIEREYLQAVGRADTKGKTDQEALHLVLSQPENRYLARHLCWVLTVEGIATYILAPQDPSDYQLLIEATRPQPSQLDVDIVVGVRGPIADPAVCQGLTLPIVVFDQIYSFDRDSLINSIPLPESVAQKDEKKFRAGATELFDRIMQMADNAGATDEHRALNYLAVRYPAIYAIATDAYQRNQSLTGVGARPSRLSGTRNIVDVIFSFTHRQTDVTEKYFVRVDVSDKFPFLVSKLSPFFDR